MSNNESSWLRAKRINVAKTIVDGIAVEGEIDSETAALLVNMAKDVQRGGVTADDIQTTNFVGGLYYLHSSAMKDIDDLRREIAAFRKKLDQVIAAQELSTEDDGRNAQESLSSVEAELAKPQPNKQKVLSKLNEVSTIVTKSAEIAQQANTIGAFVIQLAPVAALLWQAAQRILGM